MLLGILRMPMPEFPDPVQDVQYVQFVQTARKAADRIERLERELAETRRNAEQYRWLRDKRISGLGLPSLAVINERGTLIPWGGTARDTDEAIADAMKEEGK